MSEEKKEASASAYEAFRKEQVPDKFPDKEEVVTMTKSELEELKESIRESMRDEIREATGPDKLKKILEQNSVIKDLTDSGEERIGGRVQVNSNPTLANMKPIDMQARIAKEYADQLKGKVPRFVSTNAELRSLRRFQGYEPVRDAEGNEVRYVDGVLMGIPAERYAEEIEKPRQQRKAMAKPDRTEQFFEKVREAGLEPYGDGITYDQEVTNG